MTKLEQVIYGLDCCSWGIKCSFCPYKDEPECKTVLMCDTLNLLKEQEPITPCIRGEEGFSYNDLTRQYGCGSCGKPIDRGDEFCRHCGKAVKWDGGRLNENL